MEVQAFCDEHPTQVSQEVLLGVASDVGNVAYISAQMRGILHFRFLTFSFSFFLPFFSERQPVFPPCP